MVNMKKVLPQKPADVLPERNTVRSDDSCNEIFQKMKSKFVILQRLIKYDVKISGMKYLPHRDIGHLGCA